LLAFVVLSLLPAQAAGLMSVTWHILEVLGNACRRMAQYRRRRANAGTTLYMLIASPPC
jgi:hypothetical protein